jgi:protein O-GlcNAc transferase
MTISQALQMALQHHQAGRISDAETLYRQILAAQPKHVDALHLLGVIAHQAGHHGPAADLIRQSIEIDPKNSFAHCNLGEVHRATGRFKEAIACYRRALQIKDDYPEALNNLGAVLKEQGLLEEAIANYHDAIRINPDYAAAHINLGAALVDREQFHEAVAAGRRAVQLLPHSAEAHNNLGAALAGALEFDEATAEFRRAIELKPDYPEALHNLGAALAGPGELDEAIAVCRHALRLRPSYAEAHCCLGGALRDKGQLDEAIAAHRRALELKPHYVEAHINLGNALRDRGQTEEAIIAYRAALRIKPDHAWLHSNLIYAMDFHPANDARAVARECARWEKMHATPLWASVRPHRNDRNPGRRLKIGYVSANFYFHAVSNFAIPLFEAHDHQAHEIYLYSHVRRPDALTERLKKSADVWRETLRMSDEALAEQIREDKIDVLVDLDMHMGHNRLPVFVRKPAPVQVSWLAYPGSTGLHCIGYRLTDASMDPPGVKPVWSTDEPARLPDSWCCYDPVDEAPEVNPLPALSAGVVTFGSLNNFAKMHEGVLERWALVMEAVKGSRLLLYCPEGEARERVLASLGARGIAPERVGFSGYLRRRGYLSVYHHIDIGLDPFPYNGMTTTCDAFWMGTPVLTLPGNTPASRATLSLLTTLGLQELAASSEKDYIRIAVELAGNLPRLAEMRATLRPRMQASPLMDAPRFARNVEAAYRSMWERWRDGRLPMRGE